MSCLKKSDNWKCNHERKIYKTDVADTEQLLRLIQSIPSSKAEPFKIWLAKVGFERATETYLNINNPQTSRL